VIKKSKEVVNKDTDKEEHVPASDFIIADYYLNYFDHVASTTSETQGGQI